MPVRGGWDYQSKYVGRFQCQNKQRNMETSSLIEWTLWSELEYDIEAFKKKNHLQVYSKSQFFCYDCIFEYSLI